MTDRARPQMCTFNGGEVGERALARVDLEIYGRVASELENVFVAVQGGMAKAPGTQFLRETPSSAQAIVRPFVFSVGQTFVLELSPNKIRFIQGDGYVQLAGAPATIGSWSDESGAPATGGGVPGSGGSSGIGDPIGPGGDLGGTGGGSSGGSGGDLSLAVLV